MGEEEFSIPEEYVVYIKQALDVLKVAATATARGIVSSAQWSVVVAIGFVAGIALYAMLLAGTGFALKTVLKKRKLYIEQTLPASQAKAERQAERQASRVASRLKASGSMRKSAPASQVNLGNAPAAAAASAGTAALAPAPAPAVAAASAAPAPAPAPAAASTTSDDSLAAAVARIASEQQALKGKVA